MSDENEQQSAIDLADSILTNAWLPSFSDLKSENERRRRTYEELESDLNALKAENGRLRNGLVRIIEAWDGDSESMHDDPAVIARAALAERGE